MSRLHLDRMEYFDGLAEKWDAHNPHDPAKLEYIAGLLGLKPGQTVLDAGSGTGVMIPYLARAVGTSGSVVAVDYSAGMIAEAKRKHPGNEYPSVRFEVRDVNDMPMQGEYDAIMCYSVFPHFADQQATIIHLAAGLRSRGKLMVAHSESREAINRMHMESSEHVHDDFLPPMSEIRQMMQTARLKVIKEIDDSAIFLIMAEPREYENAKIENGK
jgi:demethylmenaquinone methyltransferase/2-methoxy-6-polyprenyl-1,4-benzoquinol methylase